MIIGKYEEKTGEYKDVPSIDIKKVNGQNVVTNQISNYLPGDEEKLVRQMIVNDFRKGDVIMRKPRREFNDLSVISRMTVDQMAFNSYQANNGDALEGDEINAWKSRAMRPIVRNKVVSIAAHATANLIFPKVFAYNKEAGSEDGEAAHIMNDLMEWAGDQSNYIRTNLYSIISALVNPAAIIHTEYAEVYRKFKKEKGQDGKWVWVDEKDEDMSGFQDAVVPCDELYIGNFYEHDIQKQPFLIWRKVVDFETAEAKYGKYENFKFVKPGVQVIYNDANQTFYEVYDSNMRQEMVEEITYWNKSKDLKICMLNGVMVTDPDNPNERQDKNYPFVKFGYELMDEGKCFYYKSLAFKMMQDANIINTIYPMIIDGTFLNLMPPMVNRGGETISSDVMIPGAVTTFSNPEADLTPIGLRQNLGAGMAALQQVEQSVNDSSEGATQILNAPQSSKQQTAYSIAIKQKEYQIILGLFVQMIMQYVKDFGKMRMNDILQYLTIGEAGDIEGSEGLVYKTFFLYDKKENGKTKTKKIKFDANLPTDAISKEEKLGLSYDVLQEQGGINSNTLLYKVNPILFRSLKYVLQVKPEAMTPMTEETKRTLGLEIYDRAIQNPKADLEQVTRDFLFGDYSDLIKDPDKYITKQSTQPPTMPFNNMMPQGNNPMVGGLIKKALGTNTLGGAMPPQAEPVATTNAKF